MDALDQMCETFGKLTRLFMHSAAFIVVSKLLMITSRLTRLEKEREEEGREKTEEGKDGER